MAFLFKNLDEKTRNYMVEEVKYDIEHDALYLSHRLNEYGKRIYPQMLSDAVSNGTEVTLASSLRSGCLNSTEPRKKPSGGVTYARVPSNAHEILSEGEFNRYYVRALCRRAIDEHLNLIVYRAKSVSNPRIESQAKIGQTIDPVNLLQDLRSNIGIDTALGIPAGPNSGLSVHLSSDIA